MRGFLKIAGLLGLLSGLDFLEPRRPLGAEKESKSRRNARNLTVAALAAATVHFAESPLLYSLAKRVRERRWGMLKRLQLPRALEVVAGVILLNYSHYIQHVLHHRVRCCGAFMPSTTSISTSTRQRPLRFHFGEIAISMPYRVAQVLLIGVDPRRNIAGSLENPSICSYRC
jgi:hypothetical protein